MNLWTFLDRNPGALYVLMMVSIFAFAFGDGCVKEARKSLDCVESK